MDAKLGMPQVVVWWTTKIRPDVNGPATRADVVAVLRAIKTVWPSVKVVYMAEMHGAAYLDPSVNQPLVRHSAIAKEANLFHAMESNQVGVPGGHGDAHLPMVTNGATPNALVGPLSWSCHMHKADAVHPASAEIFGLQAGEIDSQALVGGNVGHRLATDPVLQTALSGGDVVGSHDADSSARRHDRDPNLRAASHHRRQRADDPGTGSMVRRVLTEPVMAITSARSELVTARAPFPSGARPWLRIVHRGGRASSTPSPTSTITSPSSNARSSA